MYPSADDRVYGTFVKNFVDEVAKRNPSGVNDIVVIKGRRSGGWNKLKAYASFYTKLTAKLLAGRYDIVYVHTITFPIIPVRLARLLRRQPLIFNVHGDDVLPSGRFKRFLKSLARPVLPRALMVVCPSVYFKKVLLREFPALEADRIFVSPSGGVNRVFFDRSAPRVDFGNKPVLGFVSRLEADKRCDLFIRAIAELRGRGVDASGIIVGRGSAEAELRQLSTDLGLDGHVEFLGPVGHDKLPGIYRRMNLFVFPIVREAESLGLVGIEAMAAKVPVVASNMAGPSGYVNDGVDGYLFEPGSLESLVEKIERYMSLTVEERRAMAEAASSTAEGFESGLVSDRLYSRLVSIVEK